MRALTIFLACMALYFAMLSILAIYASGACLEIRGNATGQGVHTLEVLPDLVNLTSEEATYILEAGAKKVDDNLLV
jgi:hypothetical protein